MNPAGHRQQDRPAFEDDRVEQHAERGETNIGCNVSIAFPAASSGRCCRSGVPTIARQMGLQEAEQPTTLAQEREIESVPRSAWRDQRRSCA